MLNKKFIIFFISIIISYSINSFAQDEANNQKEMKFSLSNEDEWIIKCSDIDKKYYKRDASGGRSPYSFKAINDAIKSKYQDEYIFLKNKNIIKNAQLDNLNDAVKSILRIDNENQEIDITENVKTGDNLFCSEKVISDTLVYKTKPIFFFKGNETCKSKFGFDNEHIAEQIENNTINFFENYLSIGLNDAKNKERIEEEVNKYSEQHTGIRCSRNNIPTFTIKNINQYLNLEDENSTLNKLIENNIPNEDTKLDEPLESCKNLSYEKLESRPDCEEEKNIIDENNRKEKEKKDEISKINQILDEINNIALNDKPKDYFGEIYLDALKKLINNINSSIEKANNNSDIVEKEISLKEIDNIFSLLMNKVSDSISIYNNLNHYIELCINNNSSIYKYTNFSDYEEKCKEISSIENIESIFSESKKEEYYIQRYYKIIKITDNYSIIEKDIESIRKQIENVKQLDDLAKTKKEEFKNEINNLTKQIKDNINIINSNINKLNDANKDFNPENPITDLPFINKPMDEVKWDNELTKYNNLNDQFTNDLDNIRNEIEKSHNIDEFELNIREFNKELVKLINAIKNFKGSFETYKSNWIAREKWIAEEKEKDKNRVEELQRKAEETARKEKEKNNQKKADRIIALDIAITENIKNINQKINDTKSEVEAYNNNFDPINTEEKDFNDILNKIISQKSEIESLLSEYEDEVDSLSDNYDFEKYGLVRSDKLDRKIISFKDDIENVNLSTLKEEINKTNELIASKSDQVLEIVGEKSSQIDELTTEVQQTEQQLDKKEQKISSLESELETSKNSIETKDQTIASLEDDKLKLQNDLNETRDSKNMNIYILIGILILLSGLLFFFVSRRKSSGTNDNNVQSYLSRIDELEQQLRRQSANQTAPVSAPDPTINPNTPAPETKKEPSPQEIKNERLRKLYEDYEASMKNPNLIEAFRMNYNAIGLERESKVVTGRRVTLRKVNTSFDRAIYWVVEHDKKLLVFGGRMLKVQAPSLLADDGTMARDLLQGIFELQTGPDLKTHKCAVVNRNNQIYEVMVEGVLQLPKVD